MGKIALNKSSDSKAKKSYNLIKSSRLIATLLISFYICHKPAAAYAQDVGGLGAIWTWAIVVVIGLGALFLIALRFKWIEISFETEKPNSSGFFETTAGNASEENRPESVVEESEKVFGDYKSGLQSVLQVLKRQKGVLTVQRDRLKEAQAEVTSDAKDYHDLLFELKKSRNQAQDAALEITGLKRRLVARTEEIEKLQAQLAEEHEELQQVRERLQARRHELDDLQTLLEKEKVEVDKAVQEVAREWELLGIRREELDNVRKELLDGLNVFRSSREALLAELKTSAEVWGGRAS